MSEPNVLLAVFYLGLFICALFAVAVIFDYLPPRGAVRANVQPVLPATPPLPRPTDFGHADHRHTRPGPPGPGRHRRPGPTDRPA
ncbi:hypothetical protein O3S80_39295 [Streptomyces sp. Lzd4kr]|nr:hypothetical protein [Streptomyces sp. Lzd4kr]